MLLLTIRVRNLRIKILVLLVDLLAQCVHLLLLVPVLVLDQRQLALHLHAVVDVPGQVALILLLDLLDLVPGLVLHTLALLLMLPDHLLNLLGECFLLGLFLLAFEHLVAVAVLHQTFVCLVRLAHELLELLQVLLLLLEQALIALAIRRPLLLLVLLLLLQLVVVLLALALQLLPVVVAHLAPLDLNLFHACVALDLLLLHLPGQVLHALLVASE